jgi:PAS domain S-box-containing protein
MTALFQSGILNRDAAAISQPADPLPEVDHEKLFKLTQFSIEQANIPLWWVKPNGQIFYINRAARQDLGFTEAEILHKYVWDFNPDIAPEAWPAHWQTLKQQGSFSFETRNINKQGEIYPVEVTVNYIELDGEEYNCAFVRNIRDRVAAEKEQQRLLAILNATPDLIGIADQAGNNLYLNPASQRFFNIPAEQQTRFNIARCMPTWVQEHIFPQAFATAMQTGGWSGEAALLDGNGQEVPISQVIVAHKDEQGQVEYLSTIMRDIRAQKQAELAVQKKSQELEQTLKILQQAQLQMIQTEKMSALGSLVAGVAHEINNPIGFIAGNLTEAKATLGELVDHLTLYRAGKSAVEIQNHAEEIDLDYLLADLPKMIDSMKLGCDRIKNISVSLRTFSRADVDHPVSCHIHNGIDSTLLILKHRLKSTDSRPAIEVQTHYGELPPIECFPGQLNQVFMNLIANAIDALEESLQEKLPSQTIFTPTIQITTAATQSSVTIRIADNGIGMPQDIQERIFDHLYTTKAVGKGTGLGLAISQQIIVERHNGSITVESTPGNGTEFKVTLPIGGI